AAASLLRTCEGRESRNLPQIPPVTGGAGDAKRSAMDVTIYHNPGCSNSRKALELIRERGLKPVVVEYLKTPLNRSALEALVGKLGVPLRELMRSKEPVYAELNLASAGDGALLDAIAAHPVLLNRPIVVTPKGAKLCRPGETVLELL